MYLRHTRGKTVFFLLYYSLEYMKCLSFFFPSNSIVKFFKIESYPLPTNLRTKNIKTKYQKNDIRHKFFDSIVCQANLFMYMRRCVCDRKAKKLKRVLGDLIIIMFFTRDLFFKCKNSKTHDSHHKSSVVRVENATASKSYDKKSGFSFEIAET